LIFLLDFHIKVLDPKRQLSIGLLGHIPLPLDRRLQVILVVRKKPQVILVVIKKETKVTRKGPKAKLLKVKALTEVKPSKLKARPQGEGFKGKAKLEVSALGPKARPLLRVRKNLEAEDKLEDSGDMGHVRSRVGRLVDGGLVVIVP
jgi:hypothetical protein